VEEIAAFGSLLMTAQWFCDACGSPFERVRHRGGRHDGDDQHGPATGSGDAQQT
jgi:hypothetical protein